MGSISSIPKSYISTAKNPSIYSKNDAVDVYDYCEILGFVEYKSELEDGFLEKMTDFTICNPVKEEILHHTALILHVLTKKNSVIYVLIELTQDELYIDQSSNIEEIYKLRLKYVSGMFHRVPKIIFLKEVLEKANKITIGKRYSINSWNCQHFTSKMKEFLKRQ